MRKNIPSAIQVVRSNHPVCLKLKTQLNRHEDLMTLIKKSLPDSLAEHCDGCCINETTVVVFSRSAAWLSQLRFFKNVIFDNLNDQRPQYQVSDIVFRVLVTPDGISPQINLNQPNQPSNQTINEIAENTRYVSDKQLRISLDNLVQTLRSHKK